MKGDEGCRADCAARWFLTGFLPADGGGHGVELGAGVLAILVSDCGSSRVDPRVQVIHGVLPFGHLGHPAVAFTHCHTKGRRSEQILLTEAPVPIGSPSETLLHTPVSLGTEAAPA